MDSTLINYLVINDNAYYKTDTNINDIQINLNKNINNYYSYDETYIINEPSNENFIDIYISFKNYMNEEANVYSINNEKFIKAYNILKNNKVEITDFKEHEINGKIKLKNNMTIFTSIPYDKGWKVYANGKEVNTFKIGNSLLGFDLKSGKNNITLKYFPNNFDIGISISISSLILCITYIIYKKKTSHQ